MKMQRFHPMGLLPVAMLAGAAGADPLAACGAGPAFPDAVAALEAEGWSVLPRDARLSEAQTDALAWTLMAHYAADTGGEDVETLLDLQRAAAPGLLARVDGDESRARVLFREGDVLTIAETRTPPGRALRVCRTAGAHAHGLPPVDTARLDGAPALGELLTILPEERDQ
jgi:hypothetical protein